MTEILALRPGQADWETEMWARAVVALAVDGEPPDVPLLIPKELLEQQSAAQRNPWTDELEPAHWADRYSTPEASCPVCGNAHTNDVCGSDGCTCNELGLP